jgi:fructose-1,6-bisphosphatase/sedoheptulose 1,7-bisphosphatase-like protein
VPDDDDDDDDDDDNNNNNTRDDMHTDRCGNTRRQKCRGKEAEKKLKYKSLGIEMHQMLNLERTIILVITGATGIVTKSLRKNLECISGKHSIDSLQKTAILGTSHIIRKVLQCET